MRKYRGETDDDDNNNNNNNNFYLYSAFPGLKDAKQNTGHELDVQNEEL